MNDVIKLCKITITVNDAGALTETITKREVFAHCRSIGMKEFYQAAATGLKPELTFVLTDYDDYENERVIEYNSVRYSVLRTYRTGNALEIVCKTEVNH